MAAQADAYAASLCTRGEASYFSGQASSGKIISLCGSLSANDGWLQYRIRAGGDAWQGVSVGDPRDFDLERGARPPATYPKARIVCAGKADTAKFGELLDALEKR